jgi:hypothetical protein
MLRVATPIRLWKAVVSMKARSPYLIPPKRPLLSRGTREERIEEGREIEGRNPLSLLSIPYPPTNKRYAIVPWNRYGARKYRAFTTLLP